MKGVPFLFKIMVRATSDKQLSRSLHGFFKDKWQFSKTKILFNKSAFFTPLLSPYWLKHVLESFTIFTTSVIVDHIIFFILVSATRLWKMTGYDLELHLRYRNSIWNKETEIKYCSFTKMFLRYRWVLRFLPREWAKVSSPKKFLILQKKVSGVDKVVNFKDFSFKTL